MLAALGGRGERGQCDDEAGVNDAAAEAADDAAARADGAGDDKFGYSVAIAGDTVMVGAYQDDDGGANVRDRQLFVQRLCVHERNSAEQLGRELRVQACHGCRAARCAVNPPLF